MKRIGEDIITTKVGELEAIRSLAAKVSSSKTHSWAHVWHIDSQTKQLTRETYCEGKIYFVNRTAQRFPGDLWFTSKLTILEAMKKYGADQYVLGHAKRLSKV